MRDQLMNNSLTGWHQCGSKYHQPSGFSWSRVYVLAVSNFHMVGVGFLYKQLRSVCQACIYILQGTGSSVILLCGRFIV